MLFVGRIDGPGNFRPEHHAPCHGLTNGTNNRGEDCVPGEVRNFLVEGEVRLNVVFGVVRTFSQQAPQFGQPAHFNRRGQTGSAPGEFRFDEKASVAKLSEADVFELKE